MIYEQAIIVSDNPDKSYKLKVDRKGACDACQLKSGCGQKLLSQSATKNCLEFDVERSLDAAVGDIVEVAIKEDALLVASLLTYILPLALMLLFALTADYLFGPQEAASIVGGLVGLFFGFLSVKFLSYRLSDKHYQPSLTRVISRS